MCLMAKLLERQHPELERHVIESYSRLYITRSIFRSMERTNFRCEKGTYLKAKFRLWFESGWRHALVGAELGQVLLTVCLRNILSKSPYMLFQYKVTGFL